MSPETTEQASDSVLLRVARVFAALNEHVGRAVAWFSLFMVLVQFFVVVMRYAFGWGDIRLQESIIYMHAALFLLIAGYTLAHEGHVRVDVLHERFSGRTRAVIEILGAAFFLLPLCAYIFWSSMPYVLQSWAILETSREGAGIPAVFLLKTLIPAFALLLALQGIASLLRAVSQLQAK
ncbi:MAG: TRAP transporter small permease subunit [Hyphomicrobiales bacterium]|nr:TRAP transporter small permease subunit [Hyphomicrobiales bacterium]